MPQIEHAEEGQAKDKWECCKMRIASLPKGLAAMGHDAPRFAACFASGHVPKVAHPVCADVVMAKCFRCTPTFAFVGRLGCAIVELIGSAGRLADAGAGTLRFRRLLAAPLATGEDPDQQTDSKCTSPGGSCEHGLPLLVQLVRQRRKISVRAMGVVRSPTHRLASNHHAVMASTGSSVSPIRTTSRDEIPNCRAMLRHDADRFRTGSSATA